MENKDIIVNAEELRNMLENREHVVVLDVRPKEQRDEWQIPGSIHIDAYRQLNANDPTILDEIILPDNTKVVTVCAAGKTSLIAANELRKKGIEAYSLEGGMKGWSLVWNTAFQQFENFDITQVRRTGKGCLSYILSSGNEVIIIDASLPTEVYEELVHQHGFTVKYVIETHIHADHLSRSKQVADLFKAPLFLPVPNKVEFPHNPITEVTSFTIGAITLKSLSTPGHTMESYCFYIGGNILFTGDTLFTDGVGRPDLKADPEESRVRAGLLYHSLKKLLALPGNTVILPAHASKPIDFDGTMISSTIDEAKSNISLLNSSEDDFVNQLLQKIPPTPANYLSIVEKNLTGNFSSDDSNALEAGANRCAIS